MSELTGKVQTVLGLIPPGDVGVTLPHEHLFWDLTSASMSAPSDPIGKELFYQPVSLETRWWIAYHPVNNKDNLRLQDEDVGITVREALYYKQAGGNTIVDAGLDDIGRNPPALAQVARETGVNIVMAAGYYVAHTHPADMDSKSEEGICEDIVREITVGVGETGIRAGIIKLGCSWPLADNEAKVLRAAVKTQQRTGVPLCIHPGVDVRAPFEIIEILSGADADVNRTVICHIDRTFTDPNDRRRLAETGCYLEYDLFGWEGYHFRPNVDLSNDRQRVKEIMKLIEQGYLNQILISHDISLRHRLRTFGGSGYAHILLNVVPLMHSLGMSEEQTNTLLIENPKRLLQFA